MMRILIVIATLFTLGMAPALATQSLIPSPYPSGAPGAAPLDPEPQRSGTPQSLMRDPYPQVLGDQAQGNPPIARNHRRQHLVPTTSQRKYRVDRP